MILYITDRNGAVLTEYSHFFNDKHHRELEAGASTFNFSVKKANEDTSVLKSGNGVILRDDAGRDWLFTILSVEETQYQVSVESEDASIELLNRMMDELPNTGAHPFSYYVNQIIDKTPWRLNVDQTQGKSRALTYTGQDTGLGRLLSIAKGFDNVELSFNVRLAGMQIVDYYIDAVTRIGSDRSTDIQINYQNELNNITRTESRAKFVTAMRGTGSVIQQQESSTDQQQPEQHVDFSSIEYDDGQFRSPKGDPWIYADAANRAFNEQYSYIEGLYSFDTDSPQELFNRTLSQLKIYSEPSVTYEADVKKIDPTLDLGDTVRIIDHAFPNLYLSARVSQLDKSYTDPSSNTVKFSNYEVLTSNLDERIAYAVSQLPSQARYVWIRYADDAQGTNMSASPAGKSYIAMKSNQISAVMSDNPADYAGLWIKIVGDDGQIGPQGPSGKDGIPGKPGVDGKTQYTHIAYADNSLGGGFTESPSGKAYIGIYVDFSQADSQNPSDYAWSLIKGADGANGTPGTPGADGKTPYFHIAYANSADGKDGFYVGGGTNLYTDTKNFDNLASWWGSSSWTKTTDTYNGLAVMQTTQDWSGISQYIQVKKGDILTYSVYAKNISGTGTSNIYWQLNNQIEGSYSTATSNLTNNVVTITDSWQRVSGTTVVTSDGYLRPRIERSNENTNTIQIAGIKLEKGSVATPWSPAPSEAHPKYLGTLTDFTQADSTNPAAYSWSLIQGPQGANGAKGDNAYLHIAWADDVTGSLGFTTNGTMAANKLYMGTYTDNQSDQSTNPSKYAWVLIKGSKGDAGSSNVPVISIGTDFPTDPVPKTGDQFWHQNTKGQVDGFFHYDGSTKQWMPASIQQSLLIITELDSVVINSGTINSPNITSPYDFSDISTKIRHTGVLSIKDGQTLIDDKTSWHVDSEGKSYTGWSKAAINGTGYTIYGGNDRDWPTAGQSPMFNMSITPSGVTVGMQPIGDTDPNHFVNASLLDGQVSVSNQWEQIIFDSRFINYRQNAEYGGHAIKMDLLDLASHGSIVDAGYTANSSVHIVHRPRIHIVPNLSAPGRGFCVMMYAYSTDQDQPANTDWVPFTGITGDFPGSRDDYNTGMIQAGGNALEAAFFNGELHERTASWQSIGKNQVRYGQLMWGY